MRALFNRKRVILCEKTARSEKHQRTIKLIFLFSDLCRIRTPYFSISSFAASAIISAVLSMPSRLLFTAR